MQVKWLRENDEYARAVAEAGRARMAALDLPAVTDFMSELLGAASVGGGSTAEAAATPIAVEAGPEAVPDATAGPSGAGAGAGAGGVGALPGIELLIERGAGGGKLGLTLRSINGTVEVQDVVGGSAAALAGLVRLAPPSPPF